jgi:hypothetical protein
MFIALSVDLVKYSMYAHFDPERKIVKRSGNCLKEFVGYLMSLSSWRFAV